MSNNYPDLKINGRILPLWILKNYKKYKLEPIIKEEGVDPCNIIREDNIKELRKYQQFIGSYLDYRSPFKEILVYHGLGSGKTAAAINIYNMLYNYNPNWNVFVLIKKSLKADPWLRNLKDFLKSEEQMKNIKFIHYDAPNAGKVFLEAVKSADIQKKNIYIIEEAHNFINNVYNNIITKKGNKAYSIYDYIKREKQENSNTRIILLTGTPAVNNPFELALIFNLLRPDIFPMKEINFNELYISENSRLNNENKNMFQRRILGLVSYYYGSTSDLFAKKNIIIKKLPMDKYQLEIYNYYKNIEEQLQRKSRSSKLYKSYTRQASNFVFPNINKNITGDNRPRPSKFKISDNDAEKLLEADENIVDEKQKNISLYLDILKKFVLSFDKLIINTHAKDVNKKNTIYDDINIFKNTYKFKFKEFWLNHTNKSNLLQLLYSCSCKMTAILFYMMRSKGPILVYSNYVKMEGLEIFKIYLRAIGFIEYNKEQNKQHFAYTEYHGEIDYDIRTNNLLSFNQDNNIDGSIIKIILISPAGSEGISLMNVRQVHILEPYWNEVRIEQLIGRAVRQCSHKLLPMEERKVDIFRYLAIDTNSDELTTDEYIYEKAILKHNLINTFLDVIKETAIDCELFKEHNMIDKKYNCFKFNEKSYFEGYIGPAYKDDIYYDKKLDNGLNSINSDIKKIKVVEINAVYKINDYYSDIGKYWYNQESGTVYDDLEYPIGKIYIVNGIPNKLNETTYIIDELIDIPNINIL